MAEVRNHNKCCQPSFLEVLCKSSGEIRRFANGTKGCSALYMVNQKRGFGVPPALHIVAVNKGEEPVYFGPNATLVNYGPGWKLQTVTEEGCGAAKRKKQKPRGLPNFLEVVCKSSGNARRFAAGTKAAFAMYIVNQMRGFGVPPALYIEAVKEGEEPVCFGPNVALVNYGPGWKLQTVNEEGFEVAKRMKQEPKPLPNVQFLAVACKSSGKIRRFAFGTTAGFALFIMNKKLEDGFPPALGIEAVKKGEEPVTFGYDACLVNYDHSWKLQTVTEEGYEEANGMQHKSKLCNSKGANGWGKKLSQFFEVRCFTIP